MYNEKKSNSILRLISIITLIIIVILFIWDLLTSNPYESLTINPLNVDWSGISFANIDVNSLIQTLLSALIGFLLTIIVIEIILKKSRDKELNYKRSLQFNNISKVVKAPLYRYKKAALSISYPLGKMPNDMKVKMSIDFKVLAEVFMPQQFADEPLFESKIEFYAITINELKQLFNNILINVDLSENSDLSELLSDYLVYINVNNPCSQILDMRGKTIGKELMTDYIGRELPNIDVSKIQPQNIFYPFIILKDVIEYHEQFLNELYRVAPEFKIQNSQHETNSN